MNVQLEYILTYTMTPVDFAYVLDDTYFLCKWPDPSINKKSFLLYG